MEKSLIGWLYNYWENQGGIRPGQRNICHVLRVAFFFVPLRWFFFARVGKVIAPWSLTLIATLFAGFLLCPFKTFLIIASLPVIATFAIIFLTVFLILGYLITEYSYWIEDNIYNPLSKVLTFRLVGYLPIWLLFLTTISIVGLFFFTAVMIIITAFSFGWALFLSFGWLLVKSGCFKKRIKERRELTKSIAQRGGYQPQFPGKIAQAFEALIIFYEVIEEFLFKAKENICWIIKEDRRYYIYFPYGDW